jgi:hypothetical protein
MRLVGKVLLRKKFAFNNMLEGRPEANDIAIGF